MTQSTLTHDFQAPLTVLDAWTADGVVAGAAAAIWHRGAIVATHEAGVANAGQPVTPETLFALASVSKPVTAAAVMRLVETGDVRLDQPVVSLVPEFSAVDDPLADDVNPQLEGSREQITIRHLLVHTSGLPENAGVKRFRMRDAPSLKHMIDVMCSVPLTSLPGELLRYSNVGYGVLARAAERASELSLHHLIRSQVLDPMDFGDIVLQPDDADRLRLTHTDDAANPGTDVEAYNSPYWQALGLPWAGYFATATAAARWAATFLPGQRSVLDPMTTADMTRDHVDGAPGGVESAGVRWDPGVWGLGWEVKGDKTNHWTGTLTSPATFCHWGQSGTLVWADPERELVLAVFGNRTVRRPWPLAPPRWSRLSDEIVRVADERE